MRLPYAEDLEVQYLSKLVKQEFFSYEMMWKYNVVHDAFEKCARDHLNNDDIKRRIYKEGLTLNEFSVELEEVIRPVYQSAKNCGFKNWIYQNGHQGEQIT